MNITHLVQYKHPLHQKWITEEKCCSWLEANDLLEKRKHESKRLIKDKHTTLKWRIVSLDRL
jgi:hypothetical protein